MKTSPGANRSLTLDALKLLLTCMIVGLHTVFLKDLNEPASYLFVNGLARTGVPVFFMINGYFFFSMQPMEWVKVRKWAWRLLKLYLVWMLIYAPFWLRLNPDISSILKMAETVVTGYWHLWYLTGALGAGLMLFFLRKLPDRYLAFLAISLYGAGLILQYTVNYQFIDHDLFDWLRKQPYLCRNFLFFGFPFFLCGFLFAKHQAENLLGTRAMVFGAIAGVVLLLLESSMNFALLGYQENFDMLLTVPWAASMIFLLAIKLPVEGDSRRLSMLATAIYLIHPLWIEAGWEFLSLGETVLTFVVLPLSFISALVLMAVDRKTRILF